ncbi:bcl-2-related ovarian killer protein-like [Hetaerina americana]|uniref:bcl-2-related ovarian killer protein-like n=1 Tax=Hetaerina americana TaxID=62018 RepID=UPI003A7F59F0
MSSPGGSFVYGQQPIHLHLSPIRTRRKFSFPVALEHGPPFASAQAGTSARRRFSDAVSRRLSLGWRHHYGVGGSGSIFSQQHSESVAWEERQVICQAKALARRYIRSRLKRSGLLTGKGKGGLSRLRSATMLLSSQPSTGSSSSDSQQSSWSKGLGSGDMGAASPVCHVLLSAGQELERMHPQVYSDVSRQMGITLSTESVTRGSLSAVGRHIFKNEVTWSKIVSLFAVAGGLAVDCVRRGHHEYLSSLVEAIADVIEEEQLSAWIASKGGWMALVYHFCPERLEQGSFNHWTVSQTILIGIITALSASVLLLIAVLLRWSGKFSFI